VKIITTDNDKIQLNPVNGKQMLEILKTMNDKSIVSSCPETPVFQSA
jgi:hypothetical protein